VTESDRRRPDADAAADASPAPTRPRALLIRGEPGAPASFQLRAPYEPCGDQPQAIRELVEGLRRGDRFQTLLGVTGSGKTFSKANVVAPLGPPTQVISHNKTLAAHLNRELNHFFPEKAVGDLHTYYDY
jgi:excinuclease ABC subunit B